MPWLIQHKCNLGQAGESEYAVMLGKRDGVELTRVICPAPDCREEFYIIGHDVFAEAIQTRTNGDLTSNLPPGFLIARSRRSD